MKVSAARTVVAQGPVAGVAGGLVMGAAMVALGSLPTIASLVRTTSSVVGFAVHLAVAAVLGAGLAALVAHQRTGAGETLFWGLAYGAFWWFLGALTLLPLLSGQPVDWSVAATQAALPSLLGHLLYGAVAGLVLVLLPPGDGAHAGPRGVSASAALRGLAAGLAAVWLLVSQLGAAYGPLALTAMQADARPVVAVGTALVGLVAGLGFALLYPGPGDGHGYALIRGTAYGFLLWVVLALTVVPVLRGAGLAWSPEQARDSFVTLPGYLLLGALTALAYGLLGGLGRVLFSGPAQRGADAEGAGTRGLRAATRGALAGTAGGLLFTLVMVQIGFLGTVAELVGRSSAGTGLAVHIVISILIGASYGLVFRRQTYDPASALGWGVAYGLLWWVLGALTLLPVWLGGDPQWTPAAAAAAFPSLVGHIAYGAVLGVSYYLLEARDNPWWRTRTQSQALRVALRQEQLQSAAPAVWVVILVLALVIPIVLAAP